MGDGDGKVEDLRKTTTRVLQKKVQRGVEALTSEDGPLIALVAHVRESNELAAANNKQAARSIRLMQVMLGAMLLQMLGMGISASAVQDAARDLMKIAETQKEQQVATENLKEELEEQFDHVPRIVADEETGQLKVVAQVLEAEHTHDDSLLVHPVHPEKRAPRKKSRRVEFLLDSFPMEAPVAAE